MLLLLRFLPFTVGVLSALLFAWQAKQPNLYPWIALGAPVCLLSAGILIARKHLLAGEIFEKLLPPILALTAFGYGMLLLEGRAASLLLSVLAGGAAFASLELLFLLVYLPNRYPVNGLSHLNLSLVPLIVWLAQYISVGLTVFVQTSRAVPILVLTAVMALLFRVTSHAEAPLEARRRWSALGVWLGLHLGLLGAFLPLNLAAHGSIAAVIAAAALRARRYGIEPRPSSKLIAFEATGAFVLLVALTLTARWT